jgi:hypothetical protein
MVSGQKSAMPGPMKQYGQKKEIPAIFSSLAEARDSLVSLWHINSYSSSDSWDPANEELPMVPQTGTWQVRFGSIQARWSSAYDAYLNIQGDNLTDKRRKGTAILRILRELGSTSKMLTRATADDQRNWDSLCFMFQEIVSLAEDIVELDLSSTAERPTFCADMALVGLLFEVSSASNTFFPVRKFHDMYPVKLSRSDTVQVSCRCRDPIIRRRAISILRNCGRVEGVWDALLTSKMAQRVVDIEEAGLQGVKSCEDIPEWARLSNVSPVFDSAERRAMLTYSRLGSKIMEVIEW